MMPAARRITEIGDQPLRIQRRCVCQSGDDFSERTLGKAIEKEVAYDQIVVGLAQG